MPLQTDAAVEDDRLSRWVKPAAGVETAAEIFWRNA